MTTAKQGKLRDLDTIPHYEIEEAIGKIKRNQLKRRLIRAEMERQTELEHPAIAQATSLPKSYSAYLLHAHCVLS